MYVWYAVPDLSLSLSLAHFYKAETLTWVSNNREGTEAMPRDVDEG